MQKNILLLSMLIAIAPLASGQDYGNEWIDWNNSNPYLKISVAEDGIYRVDYKKLNAAVSATGHNLSNLDPQDLQLFYLGKQQPIYVEGESDGSFDFGDFIEFFGKKNDGTFDKELYASKNNMPNPYYSLFNDTSAYFLTWNDIGPKERMTIANNSLNNLPPKENFHWQKELLELHNNFQGGHKYFIGNTALYSAKFENGEGYTGSDFNKSSQTHNFTIDNIYASGPKATVRTNLVGIYDQEHKINFSINGTTIFDQTIKGQIVHLFENQVALSIFKNGSGNDQFTYLSYGSGSSDRNAIGYIEVIYPRLFDFNNQSQFKFTLTGTPFTKKYLEINNFNHNNQPVYLYDLSNAQRMTGIVNSNILKYHIPLLANDTIDYLLVAQSEINTVQTLKEVEFINYFNTGNQGQYLMVYHPKLTGGGTGTNWVETYRQYRKSAAGGGFNAKTISIQQLYDQFAYGIRQHPLSIQNFVRFALDNFQNDPTHLFLIGKAIEYPDARTNISNRARNLVPSFGHPAADNLLAAPGPQKITTALAVGRIIAENGNELKTYYDKITTHEGHYNDIGDGSISGNVWKRRIIHFGGGNGYQQQQTFRQYLNSYKKLATDTSLGAEVISFFKTSPDPIEYIQSQYIDSLINDGVALMTFFGHSNANSFDVNIDKPQNYPNDGKFPVLLSNGCYSGFIHGPGGSLSKDFVLTPGKGALGFLAITSTGVDYPLNIFSKQFYRYLANNYYQNDLGTVIKETMQSLNTNNQLIMVKLVIEQKTLHGDPAIMIGGFDHADVALEKPQISFTPQRVTVDMDSFDVNVVVHNLGRALDEEMTIQVLRTFSDGSTTFEYKTVKVPYLVDTFQVTFYTDPLKGINQNVFEVTLDPSNELTELRKANNVASQSLFINSDDAFPIHPYRYSMVSGTDIILKSYTADPFAEKKKYILQLDTTANFNSQLLEQHQIEQGGGVINWTPSMAWEDSVVYYWRISPEPTDGTYKWHRSSFTYFNKKKEGWRQGHYFQYDENNYRNVVLKSNRQFNFVPDKKDIRVVTGVYGYTPWDDIAYFLNGERQCWWSCLGPSGKAVIVAVFDSSTGLPWDSWETPYGHVMCDVGGSNSRRYGFHFQTHIQSGRKALMDFLDTIPNGNYILAYSFQHPQYHLWKDDSTTFGTHLFEKFTELGGSQLNGIETASETLPFAFFTKKGYPSQSLVAIGSSVKDRVDTTYSITGKWNKGSIKTQHVGPATKWDTLRWDASTNDPTPVDEILINIYGVKTSNQTDLLANTTNKIKDLSFIDATVYPNLIIQMNVEDDSFRTPPQIDYWQIIYDPVPELAVNPLLGYKVDHDTLDQGQELKVQIAMENISGHHMDSLLVKLSIIDNKNNVHHLSSTRMDSVRSGEIIQPQFTIPTMGYTGANMLLLEANPNNDQSEYNHQNNYAFIPFYVHKDRYNPLLDVTFDGHHIMNGDIISATPEIRIELKDENQFLALNDTSLMDMILKHPSGKKQRISYTNINVEFQPADTSDLHSKNKAEIIYRPTLNLDGTYQLIVQGRDRSGNQTGDINYIISFKVINKPMISNVVNYPNPFTSSTKFVFTLTGSEVPDNLKIQIMTVSGKVVRTIGKNELGPIRIGNNITEFAWDGTDEYGDPLANGLYLYRVVASNQGQQIDHFETSLDKYFKSGIGKMYLAR